MAEEQNKGESSADTDKPAEPAVVLPLSTPLDQGTGEQADNYLAQRNAPTIIDRRCQSRGNTETG